MNYEVGNSIRIVYESERLTTGLADVSINVFDSNGNEVVTGSTMTELGSGIYYFDYIPLRLGTHIYKADSTSQPRAAIDKLIIQDTASIVSDNSKGGGGDVSADIAFDLKRLADNSAGKQELGSGFEDLFKALDAIIVDNQVRTASLGSDIVELSGELRGFTKKTDTTKLTEDLKNTKKELKSVFNKETSKLTKELVDNKKEISNLVKSSHAAYIKVRASVSKDISIFSDSLEKQKDKEVGKIVNDFNKKLDLYKDHNTQLSGYLNDMNQELGSFSDRYDKDNINVSSFIDNTKKSFNSINKSFNDMSDVQQLVVNDLKSKTDEMQLFYDLNKETTKLQSGMGVRLNELFQDFNTSFETFKKDTESKNSQLVKDYDSLLSSYDQLIQHVDEKGEKLNKDLRSDLNESVGYLKESMVDLVTVNVDNVRVLEKNKDIIEESKKAIAHAKAILKSNTDSIKKNSEMIESSQKSIEKKIDSGNTEVKRSVDLNTQLDILRDKPNDDE